MEELEKKTIRYIERMIELIKFTQYPRTKEDMARFLFKEDTFNKLGYKAKINTHTMSYIN